MATPGEPQSDRDKGERIHLLVLLIWFGGLMGLLMSHHLEPYETWSWGVLKLFIALVCRRFHLPWVVHSRTRCGQPDAARVRPCSGIWAAKAASALAFRRYRRATVHK